MWIIFVSICSAITLVVVLVLCSCWKRQRQKDDWLGLDGMVKQKNPDENVNHIPLSSSATATNLPVVTECTINVAAPDAHAEQTNVADAKRPTVQTNTRRSLPDIPSEGQNLQAREGWDANGDNSSELYATVEPYNNLVKRHTLPNGIDSRPSISQHSSISQADDAPYASVNYEKLHQVEHPYAIVKPPTVSNEENAEPTARTSLLSAETSAEPHAPPRSRRSSGQSFHIDINAASAVSGGIAANQDLPYMTPPIANQQVNFSGDSQDSSKGYTSISVREPLANIRAQTKELDKTKRALDPHYSTVSDDSDEMYTTIPDSINQVYTSGSETYAQIQLTVAADINPVPSNLNSSSTTAADSVVAVNENAPQPPSVDSLKNMTNSHSRQEGELFAASSTSSILNLGSPKPEKRQANSPLPPPPTTSLSPDNGRKNLDDMYAKVQKNRKKSEDTPNRKSTSSTSSTTSDDKKVEDAKQLAEHNYETLKKSPKKNVDPGYEELKSQNPCEPGYASINGPDSLSYEDPNYEQLKDNCSNSGYSTIKEPDLGYSVINKTKRKKEIEQVIEPNYESMPSETDPNYESVRNINDPNYESVKYLDVGGGYERLHTDDDTDSTATTTNTNKTDFDNKNGYETVDSSTKSTNSMSKSPPYEKLDEDGKTDSESSGYERIEKSSSLEEKDKGKEESKINDDYETIKNDLSDCLGDEDAIFEV